MAKLTEKQLELLLDKLDLWQRFSHEGNDEHRDYHRRCAEALAAALAALKEQGDE